MGWEWRHRSRSLRRGDEKDGRVGCMSGVLQFLDFHPLLCYSQQPTSSPDSLVQGRRSVRRGVDSPRKSLDFDQTTASCAQTSMEGDEFDAPIRIAPARDSDVAAVAVEKMKQKKVVGEIEKSSSPAVTPRTSTVVARLMGLELLPCEDFSSPTTHHRRQAPSPPPPPAQINTHQQQHNRKKQTKKQCRREPLPRRQPLRNLDGNIEESDFRHYDSGGGTHSLPETPRVSTARNSWDSDPRLSLQLNKENSQAMREFNYLCEFSAESSPSPSPLTVSKLSKPRNQKPRQIQLGENRSPSDYAGEIVKQVKESVGKRITSRVSGNDCNKDLRIKSRLVIRGSSTENNARKATEESTRSRSSATRYSEPFCKNNFQDLRSKSIRGPSPPPPLPAPSSPFLLKHFGDPRKKQAKELACSNCKKYSSERFNERLRKPSTATQRTRTASPAWPLPSVEIPPKSAAAGYKPQSVASPLPAVKKTAAAAGGPELEYVRSILDQTGVRKESCVTSARWYSPAHPLDPIIFHKLELALLESEEEAHRLGPLRHRCNRKLLFHLVDEVLEDLLRPYLNTKPWLGAEASVTSRGEVLERKVGSRIMEFPAAECRVMEDIDLLVCGDLTEDHRYRILLQPSVREEVESVALEVERDLLDSLVVEAAASLALPPVRCRR